MFIKDKKGNILKEEYIRVTIQDYPEIVLYVPSKRLDEFLSLHSHIIWGERDEVTAEDYQVHHE
jgi:hypothetical protein